jgi:hypothetical protein
MNYAILINPYVKEIRLTKTIDSFIPPKEIKFESFFGKERKIDKEFFIFEDGELKKFKGLYLVVGENVNYEIMSEIESKIIWCD